MNQFTMQFPSFSPGDCHFHGTLATDTAGRLYDSRFRQTIESRRRPLTEHELRAVEAVTALRIASRLMRQRMDRWAEKHGLSEGRLHVLFQLLGSPERMLPLGELADQLDVSPRNITGLIDHLERDGLVERVDDPDDRRSIHARLTQAGAKVLHGMRAEGLKWQTAVTEGLSDDELEHLRHACLRLVENLSGAQVAVGETA
jgi:DNA-binding MarR family transcriptional regulator